MIIVADGPSAKGFVPPDGIDIIAVNGAIEWLQRADYWFTLDPSPVNYDRMRRVNRNPDRDSRYCCRRCRGRPRS